MVQYVRLLVFLHGVLSLQTGMVLGVLDESSDSSPRRRTSYYIFQMLPMQRRDGKPEKVFAMKAASLPALRPSSVWGAPEAIRPVVNMVANLHPQPSTPIPRQSDSTLATFLGSTTLTGPILTLSTKYKMLQRNGGASMPSNEGTHHAMSARFPLTPQVLTTSGLPIKETTHSVSPPSSSMTKEPRGDI